MESKIWHFLLEKLNNPYGVSALMGNLYVESHLDPYLLEGSKARKLGMSSAEYTTAVDNGSYTNFVNDSAGYGLAQWTYWSRKENLLNYAKARHTSIGDIDMQLDFLWEELQGYKTVLNALLTATNIREASDVVVERYEKPKSQTEELKQNRANYGQKYFDKYAEVGMNTWKQVQTMLEGWQKQNLQAPDIVVNLANACLGWSYVFGARGVQCIPANRRSYYNSKQKPTIKSKCKNFEGTGTCSGCQWYPNGVTLFFDCMGFTYFCLLKGAGIKIMGGGATSQYNDNSNWDEKGLIENMPKDKVCCGVRKDASTGKMEHTLLYDGKVNYIHCSGTVKKCKSSAYKATHYAVPKGLYSNGGGGDIPVGKAVVHASSGSTVNMRAKPSISADVIARIPVNSIVDVLEKGTEWTKIKYSNQSGYMMNKFLIFKDEPTPSGETITVNKAELEKVYAMIGDMLKG